MTRTFLALAVLLLPVVAEAAPLRTSLPTHVGAPRAEHGRLARLSARQPTRDVAPARAPARRAHHARRQTVAPETIHVHDGDTLYIGADAFRLRGIDTPELGEPRAEAARQRLRSLLRSGPVTIVRRAEDVYGRIVADVYVGGRSVARTLRLEGYAKPRAPSTRHPRRLLYRSLDIPTRRLAWDVHR